MALHFVHSPPKNNQSIKIYYLVLTYLDLVRNCGLLPRPFSEIFCVADQKYYYVWEFASTLVFP